MKKEEAEEPMTLWSWQEDIADEIRRFGSVILYDQKPETAPNPQCFTLTLSPPKRGKK